jgi:hypothetical protein
MRSGGQQLLPESVTFKRDHGAHRASLRAVIIKILASPWNRNLPFCVWWSDGVGRIVDIFAGAPGDLKRQQKLRGGYAENSASDTVGSVNTLVVVSKRVRGHSCAFQSVNDKVNGAADYGPVGCSALGRLSLHCFLIRVFSRGRRIRGRSVNLALPGAPPCPASFGGSEPRLLSHALHPKSVGAATNRGQIASSFDTDLCRHPGWSPALSKR